MNRIQAPRLQGYDGAIAANNSMASAFANISKSANDWMGQKERKRNNLANEAHRTATLDETKNQNVVRSGQFDKSFGLNTDKFNETKNQNVVNNTYRDGRATAQDKQNLINNSINQQRVNVSKTNVNKTSDTNSYKDENQEYKRIEREKKILKEYDDYVAKATNFDKLDDKQKDFFKKQFISSFGLERPTIEASEPFFGSDTYNVNGYSTPIQEWIPQTNAPIVQEKTAPKKTKLKDGSKLDLFAL